MKKQVGWALDWVVDWEADCTVGWTIDWAVGWKVDGALGLGASAPIKKKSEDEMGILLLHGGFASRKVKTLNAPKRRRSGRECLLDRWLAKR